MRVIYAQVFILRRLGLLWRGGFICFTDEHGFHGFVPSAKAERVAEFAFHSGKRLQQELTEVAESGGIAWPDAVSGERAKDLAERVIEVGSRGEIAGRGFEFDEGLASVGLLVGFFVFRAW
jgi:hypothetical protein